MLGSVSFVLDLFDWELVVDGQYKPGTWKVISIPLILDPEDCP